MNARKVKHYLEMTDKEFNKFLKTASAKELIEAFTVGKTYKQIEQDIRRAEKAGS